jgi:hypothetical protein
MASGTLITITMRVYIPVSMTFNIQIAMDKISSISNPIILGNAATVSTVVPNDFISLLSGTQG